MPPITADLSVLHNSLQLGFNHPSARLFRDDNLVGSTAGVLPEPDHSLAISGLRTLIKSQDALEEGIAYVSSLLQHLARLKNNADAILTRCRALVAPVRRIPVELLQHIFKFVREGEIQQGRPSSVVPQVCRLWRRVALDLPLLWTTIIVPLCDRNVPKRISHVRLWMGRSDHFVSLRIKNSVRSLSMGQHDLSDAKRYALFSAGVDFAHALQPFGDRFETLSFTNRFEETALGLFSTWHTSHTFSMPNLKSFKIAGIEGNWRPRSTNWDRVSNFLHRKALGLEHFSAYGPHMDKIFNISRSHVKVLRGRFSWELVPNIRNAFPRSLEVLELVQFQRWEEFGRATQSLGLHPRPFLENLTSLSVFSTNFPSYDDVPPLPSLRHLILTLDDTSGGDVVAFFPTLEAWGPQLDYLSLMVTPTMEEFNLHIVGCLGFVPHLKALRIGSGDFVPDVEFANPPGLVHCEFHFAWMSSRTLASLKSFSAYIKRLGQRSRLRTLGISYTELAEVGNVPVEVRRATESLTDLGIVVNTTKRKFNDTDFRFEGPYFERLGGVFDTLYALDP